MNERDIQSEIQIALSKSGVVNFRNNTGLAWVGIPERISPRKLILHDPRPLHAGLCKGSSDLIGWESIEITADMVGRKVAIFAACEVKKPGQKVKRGSDQENFLSQLKQAGGIALEAHSVEEALGGVKKWKEQSS
jgi:hypothetical protein